MKKLLAYLLTIAITATAAIGGTVAYLTSEDKDVNVMTLGNVKIEQHEYQRATNEDGTYETDTFDEQTSYVLEDFEQGKDLLPIVGDPNEPSNSPAYAGWDDTIVRMTQVESYGSMQVFAGKNAQDKFVTVENTGKTDAYIRTIVAIEVGSTDGKLIGSSHRAISAEKAESDTAPWIENNIGIITIDENNYMLSEYIYRGASDVNRHINGVLPAGDTTYPSLCQVYLKHNATNEDMEAIDGNDSGTLDILVLSQAIQADGFVDAQTALDTAFGDITTTNHPWMDTVIATELGITEGGTYDLTGDVYTIDTGYFHTQNVEEEVTINGNGAVVEGIASSVDSFGWEGGRFPAMSPIFSSKNGDLVTVNDLTFTGTMSAVMAGNYVDSNSNWFNTKFSNVNIIDAEVVSFSQNISPALVAYGTFTMENCNVYGTTLSELDTDPMYPVYDVAMVNYSDTTIKNSKIGSVYMWNQAKVTVEDGTEIDTIVIRGNMNTTNYGLKVEAGAIVDTIDLSNINNVNKINITIAEGATVGSFVDDGVEYATIEEWKAAQ